MTEIAGDLATSQTMRKDAGKVRMDLVPAEWIEGLAEVCTMGAEKYEPWLWTKGMPKWRFIASGLRHTYAWIRGERLDGESGLDHRLHAAWNLLADYSYDVRGLTRDGEHNPAQQTGPDKAKSEIPVVKDSKIPSGQVFLRFEHDGPVTRLSRLGS